MVAISFLMLPSLSYSSTSFAQTLQSFTIHIASYIRKSFIFRMLTTAYVVLANPKPRPNRLCLRELFEVAFPATGWNLYLESYGGGWPMKRVGTLSRTLAVVSFSLAVLLFASLASAQQSQLQAYTAVSPATDAGGKPIGPAQAAANSNLATFNYTSSPAATVILIRGPWWGRIRLDPVSLPRPLI